MVNRPEASSVGEAKLEAKLVL